MNFPPRIDLRLANCRHNRQQQSANRNKENFSHGSHLILEEAASTPIETKPSARSSAQRQLAASVSSSFTAN